MTICHVSYTNNIYCIIHKNIYCIIQKYIKTRLISIESQPLKIVVVVVVIIGDVVVVVHVVVVVIPVVDTRYIPLKFVWNHVINRWDVVDVVVVSVFVVFVVVVVVVDPKNLLLKLG